jgi:hypothetical protein
MVLCDAMIQSLENIHVVASKGIAIDLIFDADVDSCEP